MRRSRPITLQSRIGDSLSVGLKGPKDKQQRVAVGGRWAINCLRWAVSSEQRTPVWRSLCLRPPQHASSGGLLRVTPSSGGQFQGAHSGSRSVGSVPDPWHRQPPWHQFTANRQPPSANRQAWASDFSAKKNMFHAPREGRCLEGQRSCISEVRCNAGSGDTRNTCASVAAGSISRSGAFVVGLALSRSWHPRLGSYQTFT